MKQIYKDIWAYVDAHRDDMRMLWEELVNTESGPQQKEGVDAVCRILSREMESAGIATRVIAMEQVGDTLIGEWNAHIDKAPFVFIGHMDTVFKAGAASENPFRVDEAGNAHGPGVLDMKSGLVIALYAVRALQAVGYCERPVKFIFAGDEETLHKFSNAQQVIADEVKGATAAFNFETGYPDDGFVVGRKGGGIVTVTVQGVSAHSGIAPEKGRSAVLEAAHKIIELEQETDISRGKLINCGMVQGGIGENTVPGECKIAIGLRFPTMEIKNEIMDSIQRVVEANHVPDTTASYEVNMNMDCMETTDEVKALFEQLRQTASACEYGDIYSFAVGGVSDSAIAVVNGVPTVCGMGCKGTGNHTPEEYAEVESLFQRCVLAACAVYDYQEIKEDVL